MITQGNQILFLMKTVELLPHLTKHGKSLLKATISQKSLKLFDKKQSIEISSEFPVVIYECEKCHRYSFVSFERIFCKCEKNSIGIAFRSKTEKKEFEDFWNRWLLKFGEK